MGSVRRLPAGTRRRFVALLGVAIAFVQFAILPLAASEPYLHEIATRSGRTEVFTAATHPEEAAHLETSPVRDHACALDCYLSSRTRAEAPHATVARELVFATEWRPADPPIGRRSASCLPPSSRAPPLT